MFVSQKEGIIWAIDPGLTGAIARMSLDPKGEIIETEVIDTPIFTVLMNGKKRSKFDVHAMANLVRTNPPPNLIIIESVHAMPRDGGMQAFSLGYGLGIWAGLLEPFNVELVSPQKWKRGMKLIKEDKEKSRLMAIENFPGLSERLSRKKDHNRAEALLLALYGKLYIFPKQRREALILEFGGLQ